MNTQQEIAPDVDERILNAFLVSFIHQDRGRPKSTLALTLLSRSLSGTLVDPV